MGRRRRRQRRQAHTLIGQGFQITDPGRRGHLADSTVEPAQPRTLTLGELLPVSAATGLSTGGNLVNLPFSAAAERSAATPPGGIAFGIVGDRFNINLALQALATLGQDPHARSPRDRHGREQQGGDLPR